MILIARSSFPRSSLKAAAQAFTKLAKLPVTVKRKGPYFHIDENDTIQATSFFIFQDDQITNEQKKFVKKRLETFGAVPGFTYSIEEWLSMEEALQVLSKSSKTA